MKLLTLWLLPLLLMAADTRQATVEQLFGVKTVKVSETTAAPQQENYGYVTADESLIYDVVPRFSGYVVELYADTRYKTVKKGDPLAEVYAPEVLQAKEDYLNALRFDAKTPSPGMVSGARAKLELLGVDAREIAAVEKERSCSRHTTIYAPANGFLFKKVPNTGSAFKAAQLLFQIIDLQRVWVDVRLYQPQLPKLAELTTFTVKATGADTVYKAKKALLHPEIDPDAATASLRLVVENPRRELLPGMYATVTASVESRSMLTLPRTAVIRKSGGWYVFLATEFEGEYEPLRIEARPLDDARFEIVSGLSEGEAVADNALFMMDADAQISGLQ